MTNPLPFKVLFWFENDEKIITEIKRTDIQSATADKSVIYKWIVIEKDIRKGKSRLSSTISVLTFRSMSQIDDEQIREFSEGTLTWNTEQVRFNGEQLKQIEPSNLSSEALELIAGFWR